MGRVKHKMYSNDIREMVYQELPFDGAWKAAIGIPERFGTWIIWGASYNGKTSFSLMLAKYMAELGEKVAFLSLEMGNSKSMQIALNNVCMSTVGRKFSLWYGMDVDDLKVELKKQRSPQIIFIDSLQYLGINYAGYKALKSEFPHKLFIFISHANEKGAPDGKCANRIMYDAMVKVKVEQFMAKANSRYGGGKIFTIWEDGAQRMAAGAKFLNDNNQMEEQEDE